MDRSRPGRCVYLLTAAFLLMSAAFPSAGLKTRPTTILAAQRAAAPDRPNVLLIIMDDMGYGDLGSYGVDDIKTPNIDRLARDGVRLTDCYANGPVCSPTRTGLITGRYQQRVKIERALSNPDRDAGFGLAPTDTSLPRLLKQNGYATALIGKWHLGWKREQGPNAHGFDLFFGFLSGATNYYTHKSGNGESDLYENTTPVERPGYLTDLITEWALKFLDATTGPFFMEVAYNAVHWPFQTPGLPPEAHEVKDYFQEAPDTPPATRDQYRRMLERADEGIGQILDALERRGAAANTLVIFTNDNGGEWLSRNAPFFHRKATLWEGGIRVPCIMRWPGHLPKAAASAQAAMTMDLTASILAATHTSTPPDYKPDGINLLPMLQGASPVVARRLFWRFAASNQKAVRDGDWKLLIDAGKYLLFNVKHDPGERQDRAKDRPDLVRTLVQAIAAWEADVGPPRAQPTQ